MPRYSLAVILAVIVASLNSSVSILKQHLGTFLTAELSLIIFLDPLLSYNVSLHIPFVIFHLALGNLTKVSQKMSRSLITVLTLLTLGYTESVKTEQFLPELRYLLKRELSHEHLLGIWRVTRILAEVADIGHPAIKIIPGNIQ